MAKTKEATTNEEAPSQHAPVIDVIKEVVSKEVTEGEKCVSKRKNAASSQSGTLGMMESKSKKVDEEAGPQHVTEIDDKPAE